MMASLMTANIIDGRKLDRTPSNDRPSPMANNALAARASPKIFRRLSSSLGTGAPVIAHATARTLDNTSGLSTTLPASCQDRERTPCRCHSSSIVDIGNITNATNSVATAAGSTPGGPYIRCRIGNATNAVLVIEAQSPYIVRLPMPRLARPALNMNTTTKQIRDPPP